MTNRISNQPCLKVAGFTLIEMMITLAVVAIVSTLAFPVYSDYVTRSRRSEAEGIMLELAQYMEQQYVKNGRYSDAGNNAPTLPYNQSPKIGDVRYAIKLTGVGTNTYKLTAESADDPCSPLSIDQSGTQLPTTTGCWLH